MLVRFFLTALLAAGLASAQRGGGGGGGEGGMGGEGIGMNAGGGTSGMPGGMRRQTREELLFEKLKLNKEQKRKARQSSRPRAKRPVRSASSSTRAASLS